MMMAMMVLRRMEWNEIVPREGPEGSRVERGDRRAMRQGMREPNKWFHCGAAVMAVWKAEKHTPIG